MDNGKLVFNSYIAKELLTKYQCQIIDLKKHRDNNSVIFVFRNDSNIDTYIQDIKNNTMKGDKICLQKSKKDMLI